MKRIFLTIAAGLVSTSAAYASGDAEAGEKVYNKCKACHAIVDPSGEVIVKGGKVGPNLWGVLGHKAGSVEGFRYGASLVAAGEAGLVWTEDEMVKWLADPKGYLRDYLDDPAAKSKMTFKLSKGAEDVIAFLATFGPVMEEEAEDGEDGEAGEEGSEKDDSY